jgi:hypothetical protein
MLKSFAETHIFFLKIEVRMPKDNYYITHSQQLRSLF